MSGLGKIVLFAVLAALLLSLPAMAQENAGTINGRVTDKSDAVIPGVTVTLTSPAVQGAKTVITDEAGNYRFILLPPGTYSLKYELPGFKTLLREGIIVQGSRTVTLPIALEVATVAETVTVTGESPVVDVQNATVGVAFNQNMLTNLPNQRDVWAVLGMTPGIAVKNFDVGSNSMGTQSNYRGYGVSGQTWITVDGVATTEGTSGAGMYYDYSAFSEITVQAAANSAEVAVPGVYTNTVMKTGSNNIHGQVFFAWDGSQTQGTNIDQSLIDRGLSTPDAFTRYNDFSANAGGPFKKDRFWWFGAVKEEYAALKTALLQNDNSCCGQFTTRLGGQSVKLNYQLSPKNQAVWSMQRTTKGQPFRNGQGAAAKNNIVNSTQDEEAWYMTNKGQFTSILSNRATLDSAWLWYHLFDPRFAHVQQTPYSDTATSIVRGAFGAENNTYRNRHQFYSNLAYNTNGFGGNHDMKFGFGEIFETNGGKTDCEFNDPAHSSVPCVTLTYTTLAGGAIAPNTIRINNGPIADHRNDLLNTYIFAQDKWTIKKLTLNLGVRFDRYHAWYPQSSNPGTGPFANATFFSTTQNSYDRRDMPVLNMLVPRVALVYDLFGNTKTAIKGSYGRYAENTGAGVSLLANPIATVNATYAWTGTCTTYDSCSTLPITPAFLQNLKPTSTSAIAALPSIDPNLKDAYTDEYTAGIEQQIANNLGVTGLFVRKIGHRAIGTLDTTYSLNNYVPVTGIDLGPDGVLGTTDDRNVTIYDRVVPTAAGTTRTLTNFSSGNNYSTIELTLTKRMSHNWQLLTGFDWTKYNEAGIPNVSNASLPTGVTASALDPNQLAFQNNHWKQWTYKLEGTYQLPKGIHLAGTLNSSQGAPYSRTMQFSNALRNIVKNAAGVANGNLAQGTLTVNVEPNAYYLPTTTLVNFRVDKEFRFSERHSLQGVIDFSNPFNVNTVTGVSSTTGTLKNPNNGQQIANFGSVTTAISARTVKLGVRYSF